MDPLLPSQGRHDRIAIRWLAQAGHAPLPIRVPIARMRSVTLRLPPPVRALASPVIALLAVGAAFWHFASGREAEPASPVTPEAGPAWLTICCTASLDPASASLRGGPDARLAEAIDAASHSVDVAIYHFNLWSVRDALLRAAERGVRVCVVDQLHQPRRHTDPVVHEHFLKPACVVLRQGAGTQPQEHGVTVRGVIELDETEPAGSDHARMRQAGIGVRRDSNPGTMHYKPLLIEEGVVSTGSYNFTRSAEESSDENMVILFSPEAAAELEDGFAGIYQAATP
jgi:phosphatidylserine/phosphatidylglycerophosphate/cardiolipin synthase-like enzyme